MRMVAKIEVFLLDFYYSTFWSFEYPVHSNPNHSAIMPDTKTRVKSEWGVLYKFVRAVAMVGKCSEKHPVNGCRSPLQ